VILFGSVSEGRARTSTITLLPGGQEPTMETDKDLWRQLSREEKRKVRRDLEKHFKLRLEANDAIVKWFRKEYQRDPTIEEVEQTRNSAIRELEPYIRELPLKGQGKAARKSEKPNKGSPRQKHGKPVKKKADPHQEFTLALQRWLNDSYGHTWHAEELTGLRQYVMQRVEAMLGRAPSRDRLRVIRGGRSQDEKENTNGS